MNQVNQHNQRAWDERVRRKMNHTRPATDKVFDNPEEMANIHGWVGKDLQGQRVLCLGAGGGRHGPLYAAAGASVTVVDISPAMLELDQDMARQKGLTLQTIAASMDDLSDLGPNQFHLVVQPVSTCYVPDILKVYEHVARVMVDGGTYISQHKQPANLQAPAQAETGGNYYGLHEPYYRKGALPAVPEGSLHREAECLEFLHRWEDLVGGLCRAGFILEDLLEPFHADPKAAPGTFAHRSFFIPPYVALKARRVDRGKSSPEASISSLWLPDRA